MKPIRAFSALGILLAAAAAIAQDANLDKVLSQMDASSTKFQDMQADITADLYTAVVQDHEMQTGKTAFRRIGGSLEMITKILTDNGQPAERDILYKNGELDFYQPALKQETIFTSGANRGEYDSLLATGFGATSRDLSATWTVSFQGMETVDGVQTAKLDLVPRQANIRNSVSHITIWLDPARDISLKQVMYQPTGDSRTVTYSNIRYNNHPSASLFTLKLASGTQVQRK
jgi:outer membrane lipoprotein-sorting protein